MLLYSDPLFLEHETGRHPETPERLRAVTRHLDATGLSARCRPGGLRPASQQDLTRIHTARHVEAVQQFAAHHGGYIEADTVVSPRSYEVAVHAAGAVADAVRRVLNGDDTRALCLVRPPGHHAVPDGAMGFCLLNNVAIGAQVAVHECELDRILIVDWDVHHGNGTQDAFWSDDRVYFYSIHRWPFYPGTGAEDETGSGRGLGTVRNRPVAYGTSQHDYLERFTSDLAGIADRCRPQLILLSAGFDAHRQDPIGSLGLEAEDFAELTQNVLQVAETHAGGRIVSVLEGGYNLKTLPLCVAEHLKVLLSE